MEEVKTPEELYFERMMQEYTTRWEGCPYVLGSIKGITALSLANCDGYEAGYNAAWDEWRAGKLFQNQEHADAVYKEAAEDQLADADKVMPQWISVKDRLPEYDQLVLLWQSELQAQFVGRRRDSGMMSPLYYWECTSDFFEAWKEIYHPKLMNEDAVTHWMPLPKPPEE